MGEQEEPTPPFPAPVGSASPWECAWQAPATPSRAVPPLPSPLAAGTPRGWTPRLCRVPAPRAVWGNPPPTHTDTDTFPDIRNSRSGNKSSVLELEVPSGGCPCCPRSVPALGGLGVPEADGLGCSELPGAAGMQWQGRALARRRRKNSRKFSFHPLFNGEIYGERPPSAELVTSAWSCCWPQGSPAPLCPSAGPFPWPPPGAGRVAVSVVRGARVTPSGRVPDCTRGSPGTVALAWGCRLCGGQGFPAGNRAALPDGFVGGL